MTGKTKKVLEEENSKLKDELKNLKSQYENSKCKCKVEEAKRNSNFQCNKCDKLVKNVTNVINRAYSSTINVQNRLKS